MKFDLFRKNDNVDYRNIKEGTQGYVIEYYIRTFDIAYAFVYAETEEEALNKFYNYRNELDEKYESKTNFVSVRVLTPETYIADECSANEEEIDEEKLNLTFTKFIKKVKIDSYNIIK